MNSKNYFNNTSLCNADEFLKVQTASEKTRFGVKPGTRDGSLQQMKSRYYSTAFLSLIHLFFLVFLTNKQLIIAVKMHKI